MNKITQNKRRNDYIISYIKIFIRCCVTLNID